MITRTINKILKSLNNLPAEYKVALARILTGMIEGIDYLNKYKVDKEEGKGLSTNDFTDNFKNKLNATEFHPDSAIWDEQSKNIVFKHQGIILPNMTISGANFIKDGMVDNVAIENNNLIITFNTDAGKQPIVIPLFDIFNLNLMVPITYSELKILRNNGELVPGMQYRITDYQCTVNSSIDNARSAGHQFDVIVTADTVNKLNENAKACLHEGDVYFANSKLEAWELKYILDNDTSRFNWVDTENGKGVIYWMKDEFNNECPYDFKNIQFKRYYGRSNLITGYLCSNTSYYDYKIFTIYQNNYVYRYTFSSCNYDSNNNDDIDYSLTIAKNNKIINTYLCNIVFYKRSNYYNSNNIIINSNNITLIGLAYSYLNTCFYSILSGYVCFYNSLPYSVISVTYGASITAFRSQYIYISSNSSDGSIYIIHSVNCTFLYCKQIYCINSEYINITSSDNLHIYLCTYIKFKNIYNSIINNINSFSIVNADINIQPDDSQLKAYIKNLVVEPGVEYVNLYIPATTSMANPCKNIKICSGIKGTDNNNRKVITGPSEITDTTLVYKPSNYQEITVE